MGSGNENDKYDVKIYAFSPISKKVKEHNCNHIRSIYDMDKQCIAYILKAAFGSGCFLYAYKA